MNGIQFHFDALEGQKTGAFLDQRENYCRRCPIRPRRSPRRLLLSGRLRPSSGPALFPRHRHRQFRPALEVADQNAALNRRDQSQPEIEWIEANAFDLLKDYSASGQRYDTIVLDPPAFAKSKRDLDAALRGYKELNLRALKMLRPGGILVTCSCSYHVSQADFLEMLADAARDAHRTLRLVEVRGQAKDHPILLNVPGNCLPEVRHSHRK